MIAAICVYCGSSDKTPQEYLDAAFGMGRLIAGRGYRLVYGAGSTGLMGALADGVLSAGGQVTGVIPAYFNTSHLAHTRLTSLEVVETIHQRKARMAELGDAFIALPGGYGTFEELFEILTWAQIGLHHKPVGLLNTRGYFDPLLAMVEKAFQEGFIYAEHRALFAHSQNAAELLDALEQLTYPDGMDRWMTRQE